MNQSYNLLPFAFQAILFYVPRWLWKNWEAGKIAALRMDLNLGIISEVEKKLKKKLLIEYMYTNLKHHNFWAYRYFFCELLSLINVGGKNSSLRSSSHTVSSLQINNVVYRSDVSVGPFFRRYLLHLRH